MSSKSTTLVIASLVVIAAIAFFSYRNSNTPNGDEVTGAIGTVDKYRSEQISGSDVVLEGFDPADSDKVIEAWMSDGATIEELADLLGKQTSQYERSMFLRYASETTKADLLGKASVEYQAKFFDQMTPNERVIAFQRVAQEKQVAELARQNLDLARFNQMDAMQKSQVLGKMSFEAKALTLQRTNVTERTSLIARLPENERAYLLGKASHAQYAEMLGRADFQAQSSIFERASFERQSNILARSSDITKAAVFERTSLNGKMALLRYASAEEVDAIYGRMDEMGKAFLLGKANADELNRMFGRLSQTERTAVLDQGRVTATEFERMDVKAKQEVLGRVSVNAKMAFLRTASAAEKQAVLNRVIETEYARTNQTQYGRTDQTEMGRTDQTEMGRTNQTDMGRTNQTDMGRVAEIDFGRVFFGRTTVTERAAWIDRAPENERAFVAKSAVTAQRTFQAERMQQTLGRQIDMQRQNQDLNERMRQTDAGKSAQTDY